MTKIRKLILIIGLGVMASNPLLVLAQNSNKPLPTPKPATPANTAPSGTTEGLPEYKGVQESISAYLCAPSEPPDGQDLSRCINRAYRFGIAFGAVAVVFFVVMAGYFYLVGGELGKKKGKDILQNALIGLGLLLGSYLILNFINPSLVIYKPIQAPIFQAADLPSCEAIGYANQCIVQGSEDSPNLPGQVVSGKGGLAVACTTGLATVASYGVPTKDGRNLQVCKSLGPKLKAAYELTKSEKWRVTATIDSGHSSRCHKPVHPENGNCADIGTGDGDRTLARWDKICAALKKQGAVSIANEIGPKSGVNYQSYNTPNCGSAKNKSLPVYAHASDAPSIHVNYIGN